MRICFHGNETAYGNESGNETTETAMKRKDT